MKTLIKKLIVYLLISAYFNLLGCTSQAVISKDALYAKCDSRSIGTLTIATKSGHITIDQAACRIDNDTLYVTGINRTDSDSVAQAVSYSVAMEDIKYIEQEEYDSGKTLGCIIGVSVVALGAFILLAANTLGDSFKEGCNSGK